MSNPFFLLSKSSNCYTLKILPSDPPELKEFFRHHFTRRDSRLGLPVMYDRVTHTLQGTFYNFSFRELSEAFLDKYSSQRFASFLEEHSAPTDEQQQIVEEISNLDKWYHYAFAIRSSSQAGGFNFWQLYVPGFTHEELKKMIPKCYQSRSKHSSKVCLPGFSPLLVQGERSNFENLLQKVTEQSYISERDYFLLKRSSAREMRFSDYLATIDDRDRLAFRFFRKWIDPVIFFDNTFDWHSNDFDGVKLTVTYKGGAKKTDIFEQFELKEEHLYEMYPVLQGDDYPLPDNEHFTSAKKRLQIPFTRKDKKSLAV